MKKDRLYTYIGSLFILILFSCNSNRYEYIEYYPDSKIVKEKREYLNKENDSTFFVTEYYKDGKIKSQGWVVDFRSEGEWKYYYADGNIHRTIFFNYGIPEYAHPNREIHKIELKDSFQVGQKTLIRVTNLYPDQNFTCMGNVKMIQINNDLYDYEIIPLEAGKITFCTESFIKIPVDSICLNQLYEKDLISLDWKESEHIYVYKRINIELDTFNVFDK